MIRRLLEERLPESVDRQAERRQRLEILAGMFLTAGGKSAPSPAWLSSTFRDTQDIPTDQILAVCDQARRSNERGFVPAPSEIEKSWQRVRVAERKRVRTQA